MRTNRADAFSKTGRSKLLAGGALWSLIWLLAGTALAETRQPVNLRIWPVIDGVTKKPLPNRQHPEQMVLKEDLDKKEDLGLAFSGGGTRSSTAVAGELRALKEMGVLDKVRYISAVSGGAWGTLPYTYLSVEEAKKALPEAGLQTQDDLDRLYLGSYKDPSKLTLEDLQEQRPGSLVRMVCHTTFGLPVVNLRGNESFAHMLNGTFLKPLGLGDEKRNFTWSREDFHRHIESQNKAAGLEEKSFYFAAPGRPFLIVNAALDREGRTSVSNKLWALMSPHKHNSVMMGFWPVECTPLYTGMWVYSDKHDLDGRADARRLFRESPAGGGYRESFGFDSRFCQFLPNDPDAEGGVQRALAKPARSFFAPRRGREFSLADICAATGSVPGAALGSLAGPLGLRPKFATWPVWQRDPKRGPEKLLHSFPYVDGGCCDDTGVAALLARGVGNIIVFINAGGPYGYHEVDPGSPKYDVGRELSTMLTSLFGHPGSSWFRRDTLDSADVNHLLDDEGGSRLVDIDRHLQDCLRNNRPLVYAPEQPYTTLGPCDVDPEGCENKLASARYGVPGGRKVRICWVLLTARQPEVSGPPSGRGMRQKQGGVDPWLSALSTTPDPATGISPAALFTDPKQVKMYHLERFPAFPVFKPLGLKLQELNAVAANGLASYAAFNLMEKHSRDSVTRFIAGVKRDKAEAVRSPLAKR